MRNSYQGKLEAAITHDRQALNLPEERGLVVSAHTFAHNGLGLALQAQENLEAAIHEFQQAIALDADYVIAHHNLKEAQRRLALRQNPPPVALGEKQSLPNPVDEPLVQTLRATPRIIAQVLEGAVIETGWVVKREGDTIWVATTRRGITDPDTKRPSEKIEVEFFSQLPDEHRPRYAAMIERISPPDDPTLDLAVLKVMGIPADIQPHEIASDDIVPNTVVTVIGHPFTAETPWRLASGVINQVTPDF